MKPEIQTPHSLSPWATVYGIVNHAEAKPAGRTPAPWYAKNAAGDAQGLVISETTGKTIAVAYDTRDTQLLAAAPDLLAALIRLRDCPEVQMDETEPETDEARLQANAAIAKATQS